MSEAFCDIELPAMTGELRKFRLFVVKNLYERPTGDYIHTTFATNEVVESNHRQARIRQLQQDLGIYI